MLCGAWGLCSKLHDTVVTIVPMMMNPYFFLNHHFLSKEFSAVYNAAIRYVHLLSSDFCEKINSRAVKKKLSFHSRKVSLQNLWCPYHKIHSLNHLFCRLSRYLLVMPCIILNKVKIFLSERGTNISQKETFFKVENTKLKKLKRARKAREGKHGIPSCD